MFILKFLDWWSTTKNKLKFKIFYGHKFLYNNLRIRGSIFVFIEDDARIEIGGAFFNRGCSLNAHKLIKIGKNCIFGENVKIYDHNHIFEKMAQPISEQGYSVSEVIIGDNCWIGSNVVILKGVNIGSNVVIGANCLIYKDIPSNSVVKMETNLLITERINNGK